MTEPDYILPVGSSKVFKQMSYPAHASSPGIFANPTQKRRYMFRAAAMTVATGASVPLLTLGSTSTPSSSFMLPAGACNQQTHVDSARGASLSAVVPTSGTAGGTPGSDTDRNFGWWVQQRFSLIAVLGLSSCAVRGVRSARRQAPPSTERAWHSRVTAAAVAVAAQAVVSVDDGAQDDDEAAWESFSSWITARGGDVRSVRLGRTNGIRGLIAERDIAAKEPIIEIPLNAAIRLSGKQEGMDPSKPALKLLELLSSDGAEALKPYTSLIPPAGSPDLATMPDFFTPEELDSLQCPPVASKTQKRRQLIATRAAENGVKAQDLTWALCTVAQRSFTVDSPLDGLLRLLLPGIDLFNHDIDATNGLKVRWNMHGVFDGLFKVVASKPIKKGQEVCISYGGSPYREEGCGGECHGDIAWTNEQYLQRYGFVDESIGSLMVDGKWLVSDDAAAVRQALEQTTQDEDEELLKDDGLNPASRTALNFRLHLKRALAAQRAVEAVEAKKPVEEKKEEKAPNTQQEAADTASPCDHVAPAVPPASGSEVGVEAVVA